MSLLEPPVPSLADDPVFQASLSALDGQAPPREPRRAPGVQPESSADPRRRSLLELFPVEGWNGVRTPAEPHESFYGLQEAAFVASPDLRFLHRTPSHDRALADVLDAIRRRAGVVVLTGAPGLGKTTVCRALIEQLDRPTIASLVAHPFLSIEELLKTVLVDFGVIAERDLAIGHLSGAPRAELAGALHHFLCSLTPLSAVAVIVIDDAQAIPVDVLDQIGELLDVERDAGLLQIVLVGPPELADLLARAECEPLARRIGARVGVAPLTRADLDGYVSHRLAVAGARTDGLFDEAARDRLYELSAGHPPTLNRLCDGALRYGHRVSARVIDRAIVDRAGIALGMLIQPGAPALWRRVTTAAGLTLLAVLGVALAALVLRALL